MKDLYCIGCGAKIQTIDETKEGYIDVKLLTRENILCKRCFQLKHYGKFLKVNNIISPYELLKSANIEDLIIIINDITGIISPLNQNFDSLIPFKNKIMIFNRYDWINDLANRNKLLKYYQEYYKYLNLKKIFIIDNNFDEIYNYLNKFSFKNNIYLLGVENAGKTTFINKIIKKFTHLKDNLLVNSYYPGTTLKEIKVELNNHYIVDLPGIENPNSFLKKVENKVIKNIITSKKISTYIFQFQNSQSIIINNFLIFDYLNTSPTNIVIYLPNYLKLMRCKIENSEENIKKMANKNILVTKKLQKLYDYIINISDDNKVDIVIEGLCFISVFSKGQYRIRSFENLNIYRRKALF